MTLCHSTPTRPFYTGKFLSFYQYRFIHKARLNLLPVRSVQARCRKVVPSTLCRLCGRGEETLAHIVNHCHHNLGLVWERHISILERIVRAISEHLGTKLKEQPIPGTTGANRPDLTIISPDERTILLVDVSCPFEGAPKALEDAATTKLQKYEPLRQELLQLYSEVEILPFIVGALGSWYPPNDRVLSRLRIGWQYAALMRRLCVVSAISGSQWIWYKSMCTQRRAPRQAENTATGGAINVGTSAENQGAANAAPPQSETPTATRGDAGEPTDSIYASNRHT